MLALLGKSWFLALVFLSHVIFLCDAHNGYGYCSREAQMREHIRRACAYDIKRSVHSVPNQGNPIYNSFAELEYFFKGSRTENQPEPEELSQLPTLYRHRTPPNYQELPFRRPHGSPEPSPLEVIYATEPYQAWMGAPRLKDPVVKLYYPTGVRGSGFREEWYSPAVRSNRQRGARYPGTSAVERNPVELQQPPNEDIMFRLRRDPELQNFITRCCDLGCTQRNWAVLAHDIGICRPSSK